MKYYYSPPNVFHQHLRFFGQIDDDMWMTMCVGSSIHTISNRKEEKQRQQQIDRLLLAPPLFVVHYTALSLLAGWRSFSKYSIPTTVYKQGKRSNSSQVAFHLIIIIISQTQGEMKLVPFQIFQVEFSGSQAPGAAIENKMVAESRAFPGVSFESHSFFRRLTRCRQC